MQTQSNILDPIAEELEPSVWDHPKSPKPVLKPQHAHWIKAQIYDVLEAHGYSGPAHWLHLVLTGSLTTYQYSPDSDCDVSLFVDSKTFPEWSRAEMIGIMTENMDGTMLPGTTHPMQCFVVPAQIKPHDLYKPGLRSGYDLDKHHWVQPPERDRVHDVEQQENAAYVYALESADKMERLLRYEPDKAVQFWHQIHSRRRSDMAAGKGDFADSNIIYKFLNNRGLFPAIAEQSGEYIAKTADASHKLKKLVDRSIDYGEIWENLGKDQVQIVMGDADDNELFDKVHAEAEHDYPGWEIDVGSEDWNWDVKKPGWKRVAMAADPYWLDDYTKRNGPYVYHQTDPQNLPNILQNGLLPWDHPDNPTGSSAYAGTPVEPRANHVYLRATPQSGRGLLRVDLRKLNPENLNPDEDWMDNDHPQVRRMWPDIPDEGPAFEPELWNKVNEPSQTAWSLDNGQTVAHNGPIPPEAIDSPYAKTTALNSQQVLDANAGQDLEGLPGPVNVPGNGPLQFHSNKDIQRIANEYNSANGLESHPSDYMKIDPQRAAQVAQAYEQMPHNPNDPGVQQAYQALAQETRAQYDHAVNNGYNFEFYPQGIDPYPNSPREAVLDLHHNKHMYVYPTVDGYGSEGQDPQDHPLLGDSGVRWGGQPVTHNDLFRAVHDFYGHAKEGLGFRSDGEDNAYRQHAAMFSPPAQQALASETRGQNSWVNYGPYGEHNQTAGQANTVFAPQKAGIMPGWASHPDLHIPREDDAPRVAAVGPEHPDYDPYLDEMAAGWHQNKIPLYHTAPRALRGEIQNQGLKVRHPSDDPNDPQEAGVYVEGDPQMAQDYWGQRKEINDRDMWRIDQRHVKSLMPDYMGQAAYIPHDVPPEALTLHDMMPRMASTLAAHVVEATKRDGGITVSLGGQSPSKGFAFSVQQQNEQKIPLDEFTTDRVDEYINTHQADLSAPGRFLGAWVAGDTVYLDVSQVHDDHDQAYAQAQDAGQLAMYDLTNMNEIPIH